MRIVVEQERVASARREPLDAPGEISGAAASGSRRARPRSAGPWATATCLRAGAQTRTCVRPVRHHLRAHRKSSRSLPLRHRPGQGATPRRNVNAAGNARLRQANASARVGLVSYGLTTTFRRCRQPKAPARDRSPAPAPWGARPVVLVVEDETDARDAIATMLEDAGYKVLQAANGREALTELGNRNGRCDLILSTS